MIEPEIDEDRKILIDSPDQIPHFANDDECAAFWDTHSPSEQYIRNYRLPPDDPLVKRLNALLPVRKETHQP